MKKLLYRALLCLLILATITSTVACSSTGETLLSLEKDGIHVTMSVNAYRLLLGRTKATLSEIENVGSRDFWNSWIGSPAKTMDQYYRDSVLENCKFYLVSLYLFEKYELELSDAELTQVEETMQEFIKTDGGGSKTKLNAVLAEHGANYDILEEVYLMQAKLEKLQKHLYGTDASLIGDDIKTEYMTKNYVHYKQIFLPFTTFVYETDANGNDIYYKPSESDSSVAGDKIFYNTSLQKSDKIDKNGDFIYYYSDGKTIAYNTVDGIRKKVTENGALKTRDLTDDEKTALKLERDSLLAELEDCSNAKFEQVLTDLYEKKDLDPDQNTDGYYIRRSTYSGASSYLNDVITTLDGMQDGEVGLVESEHGYFIIKKYKFTDKAYKLDANKNGWFENFNDLVTASLFDELCRPHLASVTVDEAVYATVPSMLEINANYFY